jgi:hypothetical protein
MKYDVDEYIAQFYTIIIYTRFELTFKKRIVYYYNIRLYIDRLTNKTTVKLYIFHLCIGKNLYRTMKRASINAFRKIRDVKVQRKNDLILLI